MSRDGERGAQLFVANVIKSKIDVLALVVTLVVSHRCAAAKMESKNWMFPDRMFRLEICPFLYLQTMSEYLEIRGYCRCFC